MGIDLPVDFIELPLDNFDVILGMDWLRKYKASINSWLKKLALRGTRAQRVTFKGFVPKNHTKIIYVIKMKTYLRRNYPMILCHVVDTSISTPEIGEIYVVCEFEDVFPFVIPGLPPPRAVDLKIDLVPGTSPISKAPYRMAPREIAELKGQLQELLDKGYIRPSVSP